MEVNMRIRLALWPLVRRTFSAWMNDYAPSMGAAISYYTVFSLAPLLLLQIFWLP